MRGLKTMAVAGLLALTSTLAVAGPLHDAARAGDDALILKLLDGGAGIDEQDGTGETPLIAAALAGNHAVVDLLLQQGADRAIRNDRGMTALHAAAFSGDLDALKLLQAAGSDLGDADNKFGVTPLIVAAEEDRIGVVSYLIAEGVDLEVIERHGYSALTRAGYHGSKEAIATLLNAGAKCQEVDPLWLKDCTARKTALGL
jgi:ankyrin repeat protein